MHKDWCGKPCAKCEHPCALDSSLYCSPDCPSLGADGEMTGAKCKNCDAFLASCRDHRESYAINWYPGNSKDPLTITFYVPEDREPEEYIDEYLDGILNKFLRTEEFFLKIVKQVYEHQDGKESGDAEIH